MKTKIEYEHTPYKGEPSRGTGSVVTPMREGWVMRTRGEHGRPVRHDFECPVHGVFEQEAPSDAVPDSVPCPLDSWSVVGFPEEYASRAAAEESCRARGIGLYEVRLETQRCAEDAPWRAQRIAVGWSAGSVRC